MAEVTSETVTTTIVTLKMTDVEAAKIRALIGRTVNAGLQDVYDALRDEVSSSGYRVVLKGTCASGEQPLLTVEDRTEVNW